MVSLFIPSPGYLYIDAPFHSFAHPFIYPFIYSFIQSSSSIYPFFLPSFHSFIHPIYQHSPSRSNSLVAHLREAVFSRLAWPGLLAARAVPVNCARSPLAAPVGAPGEFPHRGPQNPRFQSMQGAWPCRSASRRRRLIDAAPPLIKRCSFECADWQLPTPPASSAPETPVASCTFR